MTDLAQLTRHKWVWDSERQMSFCARCDALRSAQNVNAECSALQAQQETSEDE